MSQSFYFINNSFILPMTGQDIIVTRPKHRGSRAKLRPRLRR